MSYSVNIVKNDMNDNLVDQFKQFYRDLHNADLSHLESIYEPEVHFCDPIHQIRGLVPLQDYLNRLCSDIEECRFEYLDESITNNSGYIKWLMHFRHPKLGSKLISLKGVTHIQYNDRIYYHEDLYDMGAMLYEHIPLFGRLVTWIKNRLGK